MFNTPAAPRFLSPAPVEASFPTAFHPAVREWFRATFSTPTEIQALAWPSLTVGRNCLISAPTGMGKSLAAFLPLINELLPGSASPWQIGGRLRVVYLSPLKALATDAARNLQRHLDGIAAYLPTETPLPRLSIRHGDTSAEERRQLSSEPPEILLTTPESLAVLLSQPDLQDIFQTVSWVVVDELHALAGSKRGADLAVSLERLDRLAGGHLKRVGISATATPLDEAANFLVGVGRPCDIAAVPSTTPLEVRIQPMTTDRSFFGELVARLVPEIEANRSVLVFTQSRRLAERLSWVLRSQRPGWETQIAVHHSSLAAERRQRVEQELKAGQLRAVVCSTSLEMGVDIGSVDLVVLVHPPGDVVRLLQRLGRAGHGPFRVRRGLILVGSAGELLEAAVTAASGKAGQCEPIPFADAPLDVLCQQLAGLACAGTWDADDLYDLVRRAAPFEHLSRAYFDACVAYLRGRDQQGNPWLPARLRGDLDALTIKDARTARLLRRNLGTILGEPQVRVEIELDPVAESDDLDPRRQEIGEIDPSFAERLEPGDRFLLDGRSLEVREKGLESVLVRDSTQRPLLPLWTGSGWPMSTELAQRLFALRVQAAEALRDGPEALEELLLTEYDLDADAAVRLAAYFERQEAVSEIPEDGGALVEVVRSEHSEVYYVHTCLNRSGNDALSRVVTHRLARDHGKSSTSIVADLGFLLLPRGGPLPTPALAPPGQEPHPLEQAHALASLWRKLLDATLFREDLHAALETSFAVRERFQRVAMTGLMVLRNPDTGGRRRQRVGGESWTRRRLFEQVREHEPDFVLLRQVRRELETDVCDEAAAFVWVTQLRQQLVRCRWLVQASPFAESWTQSALGGLEIVESPEETLRRLHARLMASGTTP
jgi:ATP-dependent Lhr-like helicase